MSKRRTCRGECGRRRSVSFFTLRPPRRDLVGWCDDCAREYIRDHNLKRRYGITAAQYDRMHRAQRGKCKSCGDSADEDSHGVGGRLHVDHCHETGRVRGLLCQRCNLLIGHADECVDRLHSAVEYLREAA